ncbi:MAG: hypothetical protein ACFFBP_04290 [Promethearchaeota archaeon]
MNEKKEKTSNTNLEEDVEEKLDNLWNNWASRRKCESTHTPEFIKKKNKK